MTFVSSFLISYILAPLSAGFENDVYRLVVAIFSIFMSSPFVGFLLFFIAKLIVGLIFSVKEVIVIYLTEFIREWRRRKREADERNGDLRTCCVGFFVGFVPLFGLDSLFVWVTFFVPNFAIFLSGIIVVIYLIMCVLNYWQSFIGFLQLTFSCFFWGDRAPKEESWADQWFNSINEKLHEAVHDLEGSLSFFRSLFWIFKQFSGMEFFWFGNFASHVRVRSSFSPYSHIRPEADEVARKRRSWRPRFQTIIGWIFTGMNVFVFVEDMKLCVIHPSSFFIGSLCIRLVLLPAVVFFIR
jgi:hypothetical protein